MRFLKNRTVLGVLCIVLSLIICFAVTPLFNKAMRKDGNCPCSKTNFSGRRNYF